MKSYPISTHNLHIENPFETLEVKSGEELVDSYPLLGGAGPVKIQVVGDAFQIEPGKLNGDKHFLFDTDGNGRLYFSATALVGIGIIDLRDTGRVVVNNTFDLKSGYVVMYHDGSGRDAFHIYAEKAACITEVKK